MFYKISSKRIREIRIRRNYTVSELAEAAQISIKFMYRIEEGKAGFSAKVLYNIAKALNVSCDYILCGQDFNQLNTIDQTIVQFSEKEQQSIEKILLEIKNIKNSYKDLQMGGNDENYLF